MLGYSQVIIDEIFPLIEYGTRMIAFHSVIIRIITALISIIEFPMVVCIEVKVTKTKSGSEEESLERCEIASQRSF